MSQLADELDRRTEAKQDYIVPTRELDLIQVGEEENVAWALDVPGQGFYEATERTHNQIASRIKIPSRYYHRMLEEAPELLQQNVRHWFETNSENRMIRTLDGKARAFLSDKYKRIDNEDVFQAVMPAIAENKKAVVLSSGVTDRKMYLKILFPDMELEVKKGDTVHMGLSISNGEIGNGSTEFQAFFYRDFCTNGCVFGKEEAFGMKRMHLGGRLLEGVDYQVISNRTQQMQIQTMQAEMGDVVRAATDMNLFTKMVDKLRDATEGEMIRNPEPAIEVLAKNFNLTDRERSQALINLIADQDYSRYGALNAVTKIANTHESYDRATDLESFGGKILELSMREWKQIATAEVA